MPEHRALICLYATTLLSALPHVLYQPWWLSLFFVLVLLGAFLLWRHNPLSAPFVTTPSTAASSNKRAASNSTLPWLKLSGRVVKIALLLVGNFLIYRHHHSLFGREASVSLLFLLISFKLWEINALRDAMVVLALAVFLALALLFETQNIVSGAWLLLTLFATTATLVELTLSSTTLDNAAQRKKRLGAYFTVKTTALMLLQALPLMLVLFFLFPRFENPLWGMRGAGNKAQTGLSDQMSPGRISELLDNDDIAFRVKFADAVPLPAQRYWRGPVLEAYDGVRWRLAPFVPESRKKPAEVHEQTDNPSPVLDYEITIEPHQHPWLLSLEAVVDWSEQRDLRRSHNLMLWQFRPLAQRRRFRLRSRLDYRFNSEEEQAVLHLNTRLPERLHPRSRALAEPWRELPARERIDAALNFLRQGNFLYSRQPPPLNNDVIDEFLFSTRQGFCEHFAGAFTVLMRAAGVPARVVLGYQGSELNEHDGFWVVRQSDAHAWSEVWLVNEGWVRIDPTAVVAPARLENSANALLPESTLSPLWKEGMHWYLQARIRWEAINNLWNQQVLGFNREKQRVLLKEWGLQSQRVGVLLAAMVGGSAVFFLLLLLYYRWRARPRFDPAGQLWRQALQRLQPHLPSEMSAAVEQRTPAQWLHIARQYAPAWAPGFQAVVTAYENCRYSAQSPAFCLRKLQDAVRHFKADR